MYSGTPTRAQRVSRRTLSRPLIYIISHFTTCVNFKVGDGSFFPLQLCSTAVKALDTKGKRRGRGRGSHAGVRFFAFISRYYIAHIILCIVQEGTEPTPHTGVQIVGSETLCTSWAI